MDRRKFIKLTSILSLAPLFTQSCNWNDFEDIQLDIDFSSDMDAGHLIFKSKEWNTQFIKEVDNIIVGGGIAGLTAGYKLRGKDFLLFELGKEIGGSSSSMKYNNTIFSQGAHYDWSYPEHYGKEVLDLFQELDIIEFDDKERFWNFKDKQYLIKGRENQSFANGEFYGEYLEEFPDFQKFFSIISQYAGKMQLPTRLIDKSTQELNNISFNEFLRQNGLHAQPEFLKVLGYELIDDYGAGADTVSAVAGIHYYMCRPYYTKALELFSPPQGNSYFTEKLKAPIKDNIKTNHVVKRITSKGDHFIVDVINIKSKQVDQYLTNNIVYAGQKHALKYILPDQANLFQNNIYSPWVVVNLILKKPIETEGIWQNEFPLNTDRFLGFVDSKSQKKQNKHVLSCYYCFAPEDRKLLPKIKENKDNFTFNTIEFLNSYFDTSLQSNIEKVFIKVMGHAMPIPTTNYLFNDKNDIRKYPNLTFAGVDNSRLPLLFEAVDSGLKAVDLLHSK